MAGNAAAANLEGFVYVAMNAFHYTALSFVSQNFGAGKKERINKVVFLCMGFVTAVGLLLGNVFYFFGHQLLSIYSSDPEVINYGIIRMSYICVTYFLCGLMDTMVGSLRGLGYSVMPMIVSLIGACLLRIVWINTVFRLSPTLQMLYVSYPISWALTFMVHVICYIVVRKRMDKIQ
jgi:Na+-driven multidrug efflux pump